MNLPSWSSLFVYRDHQTTYRVDPTPTLIAVSVAAAVVVLFVTLVVVAWRRPGAFVVPVLPALLGVVAGSGTFVTVDYFATTKHPSTVPHSAEIFAQVVRLNHVAFAIGVGAVVGAIFVVAFRTRGHLALLPFALPLLFAGVGLVRARHHATSIREVGYLPFFDLAGGGVMHAGRDHDVPVRLMSHFSRKSFLLIFSQTVIEPSPYPPEEHATWHASRTVHVSAPRPGPVPIVARGGRGPVTFETALEGKAVPETASPFFSLRVGNELRYRVNVKQFEGRALFFVPLGGGARSGELVVRVTEAREHAMVRTFLVETNDGETARGFELVALDGETFFYDGEHETIGAPVVAAIPNVAIRRFEPCTFSLVGAGLAECQRGDDATFALAAPASFVRSKHDTPGNVVTGLVALFTMGIVIPSNGSETATYTLVGTRPGPAGAPEAPSR